MRYSPYHKENYIQHSLPFQDENTKNLSRLQNKIHASNTTIQTNEENYMNFMKRFFTNETTHLQSITNSTPYIPPKEEPLRMCRMSEITNPDNYYKRMNSDYLSLRKKQKEFLDYNYELAAKHDSKKIDCKPYNQDNQNFLSNVTSLNHNVILNPVPNYSYNRYIADGSLFRKKNVSASLEW